MNRRADKATLPIELPGSLIFIVYRPAEGAGLHISRRLRLGGQLRVKLNPTGCDSISTRASESPDASFAAGVTGDHGIGRIRG
jgi:hypothetical protein